MSPPGHPDAWSLALPKAHACCPPSGASSFWKLQSLLKVVTIPGLGAILRCSVSMQIWGRSGKKRGSCQGQLGVIAPLGDEESAGLGVLARPHLTACDFSLGFGARGVGEPILGGHLSQCCSFSCVGSQRGWGHGEVGQKSPGGVICVPGLQGGGQGSQQVRAERRAVRTAAQDRGCSRARDSPGTETCP